MAACLSSGDGLSTPSQISAYKLTLIISRAVTMQPEGAGSPAPGLSYLPAVISGYGLTLPFRWQSQRL